MEIMEKQKLIAKIQRLKAIKPREDWVLETKTQLFAGQPSLQEAEPRAVWGQLGSRFSWQRLFSFPSVQMRPALALYALLLIMIAGGFIFWFSFESLPQNPLRSVERLAEEGQASFLTLDKVELQLNLVEKRTQELRQRIGQSKSGDNGEILAIAEELNKIGKETQALIKTAREKKAGIAGRKTMASLADLGDGLEQTQQTLTRIIAESQIKDLKNRSLSNSQQKLLEQAEAYFQKGDYSGALEKIFDISQK